MIVMKHGYHFATTCELDLNIDSLNDDMDNTRNNLQNIPKSSDIYISTKTKIAYLSQPIDLKVCFENKYNVVWCS